MRDQLLALLASQSTVFVRVILFKGLYEFPQMFLLEGELVTLQEISQFFNGQGKSEITYNFFEALLVFIREEVKEYTLKLAFSHTLLRARLLNLFGERYTLVIILFVKVTFQNLPKHLHLNRLLTIRFNRFDH